LNFKVVSVGIKLCILTNSECGGSYKNILCHCLTGY